MVDTPCQRHVEARLAGIEQNLQRDPLGQEERDDYTHHGDEDSQWWLEDQQGSENRCRLNLHIQLRGHTQGMLVGKPDDEGKAKRQEEFLPGESLYPPYLPTEDEGRDGHYRDPKDICTQSQR